MNGCDLFLFGSKVSKRAERAVSRSFWRFCTILVHVRNSEMPLDGMFALLYPTVVV